MQNYEKVSSYLISMHFACFVLLRAGTYFQTRYPKFHAAVVLQTSAVVLYTATIVYTKMELITSADKVVRGTFCVTKYIGTAKNWMTIEIYSYGVNIVALTIMLLVSRTWE